MVGTTVLAGRDVARVPEDSQTSKLCLAAAVAVGLVTCLVYISCMTKWLHRVAATVGTCKPVVFFVIVERKVRCRFSLSSATSIGRLPFLPV